MSLPNAILFPQAPLPLYIFEERYRLMLDQALDGHRMFAIALCNKKLNPCSIGGVGLIRACVHNSDGTANLVLQGVARVKFTRFIRHDPFPEAEIEPLASHSCEEPEVKHLASQILEVVNEAVLKGRSIPDWMIKLLDDLQDYEIMGDLVAYTFIESILTKQTVLEELDLKTRLLKIRNSLTSQSNNSSFSFD